LDSTTYSCLNCGHVKCVHCSSWEVTPVRETRHRFDASVIETSKRVLGPEHPDTLTGKNNLACTRKSRVSKREELVPHPSSTRRMALEKGAAGLSRSQEQESFGSSLAQYSSDAIKGGPEIIRKDTTTSTGWTRADSLATGALGVSAGAFVTQIYNTKVAQQALRQSTRSADASTRSANVAEASLALNREIFEHNKAKDTSANAQISLPNPSSSSRGGHKKDDGTDSDSSGDPEPQPAFLQKRSTSQPFVSHFATPKSAKESHSSKRGQLVNLPPSRPSPTFTSKENQLSSLKRLPAPTHNPTINKAKDTVANAQEPPPNSSSLLQGGHQKHEDSTDSDSPGDTELQRALLQKQSTSQPTAPDFATPKLTGVSRSSKRRLLVGLPLSPTFASKEDQLALLKQLCVPGHDPNRNSAHVPIQVLESHEPGTKDETGHNDKVVSGLWASSANHDRTIQQLPPSQGRFSATELEIPFAETSQNSADAQLLSDGSQRTIPLKLQPHRRRSTDLSQLSKTDNLGTDMILIDEAAPSSSQEKGTAESTGWQTEHHSNEGEDSGEARFTEQFGWIDMVDLKHSYSQTQSQRLQSRKQ
jgi:hypothetical protein